MHPSFRRRLLRRIWVPLALAGLLVGGVLVGLPWYYKNYRGALPDRGLSSEEIGWARAYAPFRTRVTDTLVLAFANRNSVDGELGLILDEIAGCAAELREQVGPVPTERLRPVAERAAAACTAADAAREEYRAAGDVPSWRTSARIAGANDLIRGAEFELRRLLLAQRALPRTADPGESRVDAALGDAISLEQPTEVLCWSSDEWEQVRAELAAVGLEGDSRLRRDVNAYRFRVHASPDVCGTLTDAARAPTDEVATALLAVLHAAQHAVADVADERAAQCAGVGLAEQAARRLGIGGRRAAEVAARARAVSGCP